MQDSYIFSDTIAANIAVGDKHPKIVAIEEACGIANTLDFVHSSNGMVDIIGYKPGWIVRNGIWAFGLAMSLIISKLYQNNLLYIHDKKTHINERFKIVANLIE